MKIGWLLPAGIIAVVAATSVALCGGLRFGKSATTNASPLPIEGGLPSLNSATEWINSAPLAPAALRGKVVLVDFWTYSCINWRRSLPYVRAWAEKYKDKGLVVIGVHSPEFSFERDADNIRWAVKQMKIDYPIAVDSNGTLWSAFRNSYWPALYFIDVQGRIRHHEFGEGEYARSEAIIQQLLAEGGLGGIHRDMVSVTSVGVEAAADWNSLKSSENYVGYERTENFVSRDGTIWDKRHIYVAPARLWLNHWGLSGAWTVEKERIVLNGNSGRIVYRFHARDLHLVMGSSVPGVPVPFRVLLDGKPPGAAHGIDVDEQGSGVVAEPRLYQLIRQSEPVGDRLFEIQFLDSGIEAFSFTFG
jgi:thiol-disulfide isomerase/thioredoxin